MRKIIIGAVGGLAVSAAVLLGSGSAPTDAAQAPAPVAQAHAPSHYTGSFHFHYGWFNDCYMRYLHSAATGQAISATVMWCNGG